VSTEPKVVEPIAAQPTSECNRSSDNREDEEAR
jgi:hypothetical protein